MDCIRSVLDSSFQDMDVYVVDNASTDDSVEQIRNSYQDKVTLLVNEENLGGSGGFNTGLRAVLKKEYRYLMCVDNDILMDKHNIEYLYHFLEEHPEVGMVGSKICRMDHPDRLQELGADIVFEKSYIKPHFQDYPDNNELPEVQYCDYVPACSLMVRTSAVKEIGVLPEENFIYWDDMEWGYRFRLRGYQVAAYAKAKVYHAMGTNSGTNYFSTYYFWRNRIRFFARYTPKDKREAMLNSLLENLFQTFYGSLYKKKQNQLKVMVYAVEDALRGCLGKAEGNKILDKDTVENRIKKLITGKKKILIDFDGNHKSLQNILSKAEGQEVEITIAGSRTEELQQEVQKYRLAASYRVQDYDLCFKMCEHVSKVEDTSLEVVYIDGYENLLAEQEDILHFSNLSYNYKLFDSIYRVLLVKLMDEINQG